MAVRRTSFHFPKEAAVQLGLIRALTYLDGNQDVIRAALDAYDRLLDLVEAGARMVVRDRDGREWPYSPYTPFSYPGFDRISPAPAGAVAAEAPKSFFFAGEAVERLESIKRRSYVQTHADAIRVALTAFSELVRVDAAGDDILVRDRAGGERIYNPHRPFDLADPVLAPPGAGEG